MANKTGRRLSLLPVAALMAIVLTSLVSPLVSAAQQSNTQATTNPIYALSYYTCYGTAGQSGIINPAKSIINVNNSAAQSLLSVSLVLMFILALLTGALYALGTAFRFDRLTKMAKSEINEIIITVIVILVFVGTFALGNSAIGPGSHLFAVAGQGFNNNVFQSDCTLLYYYGYNIVYSVMGLNAFNKVLALFYYMSISFEPNGYGITFQPYLGLQTASSLVTLLNSMLGAFTLALIGSAVLIGLLYSIFPLFLYMGIVLRSLPWTRAAGGSFLGIFLGFYIVFPLLLYGMIGAYNVTFQGNTGCGQLGDVSITQAVSGILPSATSPTFNPGAILGDFTGLFTNAFGGLDAILGRGAISYAVCNAIAPFAYIGFSLAISFIIAFDFVDAAGDLLGAPSLAGEGVLKKII